MELHNETNVKLEQRILKIIIVTTVIVGLLAGGFFLIGNLLPSTKTLAKEKDCDKYDKDKDGCKDDNKDGKPKVYYCKGSIKSTTNKNICDKIKDGDTVKIEYDLSIDEKSEKLKEKNAVIVVDGCEMKWEGKFAFHLGKNAKLFLKNGGKLTGKSGCDKDAAIYFGDKKCVSYNGSGANYSFSQVNATGGVQSSGLTTLPVKLVRFETVLNNGKVDIKWATATEINNDHFDIERSSDTKTWKVIGTVKGHGNSSSHINYSFTDNPGIIAGALYYRLHQVDFDGTNEYSSVSVLDNNKKEKEGKVYPNPANDVIKVSLNAGNYQLTIMDQSGKIVLSKQVDTDFETIDAKELPNGYYFVKIENETISESHRVVVKH